MKFKQHKDIDIKPLKRKTHWKASVIVGIFLITLIAMAGYGVKSFFDKYYFVSPVQPKAVKLIIPTPTPTKAPKQAIRVVEPVKVYAAETKHYEIGDIVDGIFTLESSRGKNDGCRDKGLYNGYGYMQSSFHWMCYATQEEVVNLVIDWVEDKRDKGFDTAELLCYYNRGIKESDCPYYRNFLTLK
jgi:hypothetical protein